MTPARTPLRLTGLVVAVAVSLTACAGLVRSPAAVVDGTEITHDQVDQEYRLVVAFSAQFDQDLEGLEAAETRHNLARQALGLLVQERLIESYARTHGITVSDREIEGQVEEIVDQVGGQASFVAELRRRHLTEEDVRSTVEQAILGQKVQQAIAEESGVGSSPEAQAQAFQQWYTEKLAGADIQINPRYGRLDPKTGEIVPITSTRSP